MATRAIIEDQDSNPLNDLERELVRQILGIIGKAGTATYIESEARMELLSAPQTQIIRALLLDYDDISFDTLFVVGGNRGANYSPQRDKEAIANELRRMLYPTDANEDPSTSTYTTYGTINFIPVEYKIGSEGELS